MLPPVREQRTIAHILGTIDDKIDLNHRMNDTLEAMARAIFKSWFVDFDPVRAKIEGRQPDGMDAETADLFPENLVESPMGLIPRGCSCQKLGDVCEFGYGKALKHEDRRPGSVIVMGSNGQVGFHDEVLIRGPGIVVGRKGNPGTVKWVSSEFFPIDTTFYVTTRDGLKSLWYTYHALGTLGLPLLSADSAVPGLNRGIAYQCDLLVPTQEMQLAFERVALPLDRKRQANENESRTLSRSSK